jgi:hypothetical protein
MNVPRRDGARKPFRFSRTKKSNDSAAPAKKTVRSDNEWFADRSKEQAATPEGKARTAALDKTLAKNAWESNNSKVRSKLDADASAKSDAEYKQSESNKKKFQGSGNMVTAEGGKAISTERM